MVKIDRRFTFRIDKQFFLFENKQIFFCKGKGFFDTTEFEIQTTHFSVNNLSNVPLFIRAKCKRPDKHKALIGYITDQNLAQFEPFVGVK